MQVQKIIGFMAASAGLKTAEAVHFTRAMDMGEGGHRNMMAHRNPFSNRADYRRSRGWGTTLLDEIRKGGDGWKELLQQKRRERKRLRRQYVTAFDPDAEYESDESEDEEEDYDNHSYGWGEDDSFSADSDEEHEEHEEITASIQIDAAEDIQDNLQLLKQAKLSTTEAESQEETSHDDHNQTAESSDDVLLGEEVHDDGCLELQASAFGE